ncbi:MAG: F0F1 ATP synthase subunit B [Chitinophagales bacterium]|nr:F0F1 ATP synthase subunit B [Chitinophagales bacterium]
MELLTPDIGLVAWSSVAFLLLLFLLKKFAWKPILSSLEERNTSIEEALAQAEKARKEIADLSARNEEILKEAKEERNNILREANKVKEQIVAEAKEKAQADAAKIMLEAKEDIEVQKKAVMADMKNAAASLAVEIAEKVLTRELNAKGEQESFINELASKATLN